MLTFRGHNLTNWPKVGSLWERAANPSESYGVGSAIDLDVFSVVSMHELDAPNPLLLALVGVAHKSSCLQGATVDPHKCQSALHICTMGLETAVKTLCSAACTMLS